MRICAWCGVKLGWWQFLQTYCHVCRWAFRDAGLYLQGRPKYRYMQNFPSEGFGDEQVS